MNESSALLGSQQLTDRALIKENREFFGTTGVSKNNRRLGFIPAFKDTDTGRVYLSRLSNGKPAPIHLLTGLPEKLIEAHGESGTPLSIKCSVISGFVREKTFYSREEAARAAV